MRVSDLLTDAESRATALDDMSTGFRSLVSGIGQLSDVITRLLRLDQQLAWFAWRSINNLVQLLTKWTTANSIDVIKSNKRQDGEKSNTRRHSYNKSNHIGE